MRRLGKVVLMKKKNKGDTLLTKDTHEEDTSCCSSSSSEDDENDDKRGPRTDKDTDSRIPSLCLDEEEDIPDLVDEQEQEHQVAVSTLPSILKKKTTYHKKKTSVTTKRRVQGLWNPHETHYVLVDDPDDENENDDNDHQETSTAITSSKSIVFVSLSHHHAAGCCLWDALPEGTLDTILCDYLPVQDKLHCQQVNRRFQACLRLARRRAWTSVDATELVHHVYTLQLQQKQQATDEGALAQKQTSKVIQTFLDKIQPTTLTIRCIGEQLHPSYCLPRLTRHLKHLTLNGWTILNDTHVHVLLLSSSMPHRTVHNNKISPASVPVVQLQSLNLSACPLLTNSSLASMAHHACCASSLQALQVTDCPLMTSIEALVPLLPKTTKTQNIVDLPGLPTLTGDNPNSTSRESVSLSARPSSSGLGSLFAHHAPSPPKQQQQGGGGLGSLFAPPPPPSKPATVGGGLGSLFAPPPPPPSQPATVGGGGLGSLFAPPPAPKPSTVGGGGLGSLFAPPPPPPPKPATQGGGLGGLFAPPSKPSTPSLGPPPPPPPKQQEEEEGLGSLFGPPPTATAAAKPRLQTPAAPKQKKKAPLLSKELRSRSSSLEDLFALPGTSPRRPLASAAGTAASSTNPLENGGKLCHLYLRGTGITAQAFLQALDNTKNNNERFAIKNLSMNGNSWNSQALWNRLWESCIDSESIEHLDLATTTTTDHWLLPPPLRNRLEVSWVIQTLKDYNFQALRTMNLTGHFPNPTDKDFARTEILKHLDGRPVQLIL